MPLIVSWHPTYAYFHNPYEWGAFDCDLQRFARLIKGELEAPPRALIIEPTVDDVKRLVAESEFIAYDIETAPEHPSEPWTGKDPTRARLKSIGLGNDKWALAHWWSGGMLVEEEIKRVLEDSNILKVGQNISWFDDRVLARYGIHPRNTMDTRDMRRVLCSTSPLSLSYMVSLMADFHAWKDTDDGK